MENELMRIVSDATQYCAAVENARESEKEDFVKYMLRVLPQIYLDFATVGKEEVGEFDYGFYQTYVDEEWYESVRRGI